MVAPPYPLATFDHRDPVQFRAMYQWAGSNIALSRAMRQEGRSLSESTLNYARKQHGIGIANPQYAARFGQPSETEQTDSKAQAVRELTEYLKSRPQPTGRPPRAKGADRRYQREIIGCDLHAPLHHEAAWEVFLATCERLQPEGITLNGDVLDLAMISRFVKRPRAVRQLQADLDWAREHVFARVNAAAPSATKTMVLGNHEGERWERYLWERCPEISELRCLAMEALLGLSELGWHYEPDGYELIADTLVIDHGDRHTSALGGGSAMSARKEMIDTGLSGVSAHTHKLGKFYRNDNAGYRVWLEGGCLCDQAKMREHRVTARKRGPKLEDWHLGFAIVYHHPEHDAFDVKDVPVLTSRRRTFCIVGGEEIVV